MNDVIVVAGATHREGFIDEYEAQLAAAGIEFHLEPLGPLPGGANSINMRKRIEYFRKMALQFINYKVIYITDAWDVLFVGTKQELLDKAPVTLLVSAERNCYPEAHLGDQIQGVTPWKYANNGMIAAYPPYLLEWCDLAESTPDMDILDQAWFNRRLAEGSPLVPIDEITNLFYVVSATLEEGSLKAKDGRPWNSRCDTYPSFMHFSGKCPSDGVRRMLGGTVKTFNEVHEFSRMAEGNGTEPHATCTATAAELEPFIEAVMALPKNARVVEIGTYTGRSTSVYLQMQKDLDLDIHLIDVLYWNPKHAAHSFWDMVVDHFNDVPFTYHKMLTNLAASTWTLPIDFLYLDGWHDAPQVDEDFINWTLFLKSGGTLAAHDSDYPGVAACLDRFIRGANWELVAEVERMTIWKKP